MNSADPSTWDILITDDEVDSIGVVEHVFRFYKASVRTTRSGIDCLAEIEKRAPDLILVDIQMPNMSGWEVIKQIRNNPLGKHIVVVAITAHAMLGDRERILAAGFNGYIPKPVRPVELLPQAKQLLEAAEKQREGKQ